MRYLQILFLNKNDLFEKKVMHSDIRNFFPVRTLLSMLSSWVLNVHRIMMVRPQIP